jgi:transcriptional regulator with XRE-family HTH domain
MKGGQMEIGKNISKLRKDNNLTQDDLAEKYFVTRQTISNWENGKSYPDLETLVKISDDFKISLDVLLKEDNKMVKDISKKQKRYKWIIIPIVLYAVLIIGILGVVVYAYNSQYNLKGISNILSVYIDEDREKEYVGKLDGYDIYVENLRVEELNYRTFNAKSIPFKDVLERKLTYINDWRKGAWYIFNDNDTEILRYESYEIAIKGKECIIRPVSKYKSVDVKCHTDNTYRITLKKGNKFECILLDKFYTFKIKSIYNDSIIVTVSDYGLTKVNDDKINLKSKEKEFIIEKNKKVELSTQAMDYNEIVEIEWY